MGAGERASEPRAYTDLTLELRGFDPRTERYEVSLSGPSVGELAPVAAWLAYPEIEESLVEMEDGGMEEEDDLIALGRALADRLLPEGQVRNGVSEILRNVGRGEGVRLRLLIWEPRLAQLPWEYTYLSLLERERLSDFLVINPVVSLVRHEPLPLQQVPVSARDPDRVRMVAVTANSPGYLALDLGKERQVIEDALDAMPSDGADIVFKPILVDPSSSEIQGALLPGADVFHFAGHGGLRNGEGFLALPPGGGTDAAQLAADTLAKYVQGAGVRVAMLGACESGRRDVLSRWSGVVSALVAGNPGVPAVVAMQYRVRDSSAIKFARAFYTSVAVGLSVEEAVTQGRLALFDPDDVSAPWGIPVLYLRSSDGVVFPHLTERQSASADVLRALVSQVVRVVEEGGEVTGIEIPSGESLESLAGISGSAVSQEVGVVRGSVTAIKIGKGRKERIRRSSQVPATDAAIQEIRLRYARGEIERDEFERMSRDLGVTDGDTSGAE